MGYNEANIEVGWVVWLTQRVKMPMKKIKKFEYFFYKWDKVIGSFYE
jgi:hypothetical protein